ncbi:MAG: hypothetical protein M3364_09600 [Actinomycetota bacterium]|nr:hypothetical protein [Actinomycetota bacterium]
MTTGRRVLSFAKRTVARAPFESAVVVLAALYVALRLSPSSYAISLQQLGAAETPLLGEPQGIRSDEWAVVTPLFQIAVNNDFQETNATSFYGETLHTFIGLPLLNWGLLFKPLVWPFFAVSPDFAYSFFWAANIALMLVGWSLLLRVLGFIERQPLSARSFSTSRRSCRRGRAPAPSLRSSPGSCWRSCAYGRRCDSRSRLPCSSRCGG